jgi:hypothetical protein
LKWKFEVSGKWEAGSGKWEAAWHFPLPTSHF